MDEKPEIRKTGTTTVGMVCRDGVVLAAEKKSTMGYLIASKESEKILRHVSETVLAAMKKEGGTAKFDKVES